MSWIESYDMLDHISLTIFNAISPQEFRLIRQFVKYVSLLNGIHTVNVFTWIHLCNKE